MTDCPSIQARRSLFLDGELPDSDVIEVRAHLEACERCRREFERERAFLGLVAERGRETAPAELRRRVEAVLETGGRPAPAPAGPGWRSWGLLAAAAVVALLFVARPWDAPPEGPSAGVAFAADYVAHVETSPSAHPFAPGAAPPPPLANIRPVGVSRCVVAGRAWAHFTYRAGGETFSIFLPLDGRPPPFLEAGTVTAEGARVVVVGVAAARRPGAVLVSDDLDEASLRRVWSRG